jgi:ferredoxin-like protein FixX
MTLDGIQKAIAPHGLFVMGWTDTRVLIGADSHWWDIFKQTAEYHDGRKDPIDRWSKRILNALADRVEAKAHFPSDGPPYAPFIAWAMATGQFWQSPTGMMIHARAGLMISIRGALEFAAQFAPSPAAPNPCETCTDKPCIAACPVDALAATHAYDVPACKAYLDTPGGVDCMTRGCHVRCACPISQVFDRPEAQSAFHMKAFHG